MVSVLVVLGGLFGILFVTLLDVQERLYLRGEKFFAKRIEILNYFVVGLAVLFLFIAVLLS